jgi:hypothetical protein
MRRGCESGMDSSPTAINNHAWVLRQRARWNAEPFLYSLTSFCWDRRPG